MLELGKAAGGFRRAVAGWAKKTGLHHNLKALEGQATSSSGYSYPLAKKLVFSKVKFDQTTSLHFISEFAFYLKYCSTILFE